MLASHWVVKKILSLLEDRNRKRNAEEIKRLIKRYPKDSELQAIKKDILAYLKGSAPSAAGLSPIAKRLKELGNERKMEGSGGSVLWFGDRRTKPSQKTR